MFCIVIEHLFFEKFSEIPMKTDWEGLLQSKTPLLVIFFWKYWEHLRANACECKVSLVILLKSEVISERDGGTMHEKGKIYQLQSCLWRFSEIFKTCFKHFLCSR